MMGFTLTGYGGQGPSDNRDHGRRDASARLCLGQGAAHGVTAAHLYRRWSTHWSRFYLFTIFFIIINFYPNFHNLQHLSSSTNTFCIYRMTNSLSYSLPRCLQYPPVEYEDDKEWQIKGRHRCKYLKRIIKVLFNSNRR